MTLQIRFLREQALCVFMTNLFGFRLSTAPLLCKLDLALRTPLECRDIYTILLTVLLLVTLLLPQL